MTQWRTVPFDRALADRLAAEKVLPWPVAAVLVGRGFADADAIHRYLNPRLGDVSDPFLLPGMAPAVDRVLHAIRSRQRIAIYGDYDVDGVTATTLMLTVLRRLGADAHPFLPNRIEEGYGMSAEGLQRCLDEIHPNLIVTVDCGTSSVESVELARRAGIDVVITDHHEPGGRFAQAVALVNPKLDGSPEATLPLAGVGVAFKFCHALVKRAKQADDPGAKDLDLRDWLDLVAVGTIADVVPLVGENRILVRHGLARLNTAPSVGLKALIEVGRITGTVGAYHIGFVIGPRLNAAGRLGSAETPLELLLCSDAARARDLARELDDANSERKRIEDEILTEAVKELDARFDARRDFGVVVGREGWHVGTIGIVAARLCSRYRRPAVVIGFDEDGMGRGSCRSLECVDLMSVLHDCGEHLAAFGGHRMAAGLEVERAKFDDFRRRFEEVCGQRVGLEDLQPVRTVDAWIGLHEADNELLEAVRRMEPLGMGNPAPVWGIRNVRLASPPRRVGKDGKHVQMTFGGGRTRLAAVGFNMGAQPIPEGSLDIAFRLEENEYNGRRSLQLNLQDLSACPIGS